MSVAFGLLVCSFAGISVRATSTAFFGRFPVLDTNQFSLYLSQSIFGGGNVMRAEGWSKCLFMHSVVVKRQGHTLLQATSSADPANKTSPSLLSLFSLSAYLFVCWGPCLELMFHFWLVPNQLCKQISLETHTHRRHLQVHSFMLLLCNTQSCILFFSFTTEKHQSSTYKAGRMIQSGIKMMGNNLAISLL